MSYVPLSPSTSNRLHAVRWGAAFIVLLGHVEMVAKWRTGVSVWPWAFQVAHLAVMAFFVLSGFIIAHVSTKTPALSIYMQERITRIYSVLVPAVILTILLDRFGRSINPDFYQTFSAASQYALRLFVNVLGLQGWRGHRIQFGTNSPLWSIGYEMFFYIVFGFLFFKLLTPDLDWKKKSRWLAVTLALTVLAGFEMACYFLIWALGVAAYRLRKYYRLPNFGYLLAIASCYIAMTLIPPGYWQDLSFSFGLVLFFLCPDGGGHGITLNAFLANFSYSLYATHLPVLFFVFAVFWRDNFDVMFFSFASIFISIFFAYLFSMPFEKKRYALRSYLRKAIFCIPLSVRQ